MRIRARFIIGHARVMHVLFIGMIAAWMIRRSRKRRGVIGVVRRKTRGRYRCWGSISVARKAAASLFLHVRLQVQQSLSKFASIVSVHARWSTDYALLRPGWHTSRGYDFRARAPKGRVTRTNRQEMPRFIEPSEIVRLG